MFSVSQYFYFRLLFLPLHIFPAVEIMQHCTIIGLFLYRENLTRFQKLLEVLRRKSVFYKQTLMASFCLVIILSFNFNLLQAKVFLKSNVFSLTACLVFHCLATFKSCSRCFSISACWQTSRNFYKSKYYQSRYYIINAGDLGAAIENVLQKKGAISRLKSWYQKKC